MLPIVDKLLIQLIVDECISAGIKEIILVTHSSKSVVENPFELETSLEKRHILDDIKTKCLKGVTIVYLSQGEAKSLGHALLKARPIIRNESFVVVLPNVILDEATADVKTENLAAMLTRYHHGGGYIKLWLNRCL